MKQVNITINVPNNKLDLLLNFFKNNFENSKIETQINALTDDHKIILDARKEKFLSGQSNVYSLDEVKEFARNSK